MRRRRRKRILFKVRVRANGQVTIPKAVREDLELSSGTELIVALKTNCATVIPATTMSREQLWFYTPMVRTRIMEAEADLAAGRSRVEVTTRGEIRIAERVDRSLEAMPVRDRDRCVASIDRLIHKGLDRNRRFARIATQEPYWELRAGIDDRILYRVEGRNLVLLDVLHFRQRRYFASRAARAID